MSLLDIWMVTCIFFVFLCIFEFIVVTTLLNCARQVGRQHKFWSSFFSQRAAIILENASKILIPLLFITFNFIYWYYLM